MTPWQLWKAHCEEGEASPRIHLITEVLSIQGHRRHWLISGKDSIVRESPLQAPIISASKTYERVLIEPEPVLICCPF
jgi:hypothetical protein